MFKELTRKLNKVLIDLGEDIGNWFVTDLAETMLQKNLGINPEIDLRKFKVQDVIDENNMKTDEVAITIDGTMFISKEDYLKIKNIIMKNK